MSGDTTNFEAPPTDLITLTRHILSQQHALGERASGDLSMLLVAIQVSNHAGRELVVQQLQRDSHIVPFKACSARLRIQADLR